MYYVGSHWGEENDGYVCSSKWMLNSYRRRPSDFRRKIVLYVETKDTIREIEQKWLNLIHPNELGKKYYNLTRLAGGGNFAKCDESTKRKISASSKGVVNKGKIPWNKGLTKEKDERVNKYANKLKGKERSIIHCLNLSKALKGKACPDELRIKLSNSNKGKLKPGNSLKYKGKVPCHDLNGNFLRVSKAEYSNRVDLLHIKVT
jgi:hypothetical protein